jgi:hypothetical protein
MPAVSARAITVLMSVIGLVVGVTATLRMAVVLAATPPSVWLAEFPPLVGGAIGTNPGVPLRAERIAQSINDPALVRSRLAACEAAGKGGEGGSTPATSCLAVLDAGLRAAPASGELWLTKADLLLRTEGFGPSVIAALRQSYSAARREGWIASSRVVFGLKLFPLLPDDLKTAAAGDLVLVLNYPVHARALMRAYVDDTALRQAAAPALEQLSPSLVDKFVRAVRSAELWGEAFTSMRIRRAAAGSSPQTR